MKLRHSLTCVITTLLMTTAYAQTPCSQGLCKNLVIDESSPTQWQQYQQYWTAVTQAGTSTGNNELEDYSPGQATATNSGLQITLQSKDDGSGRYKSAKLVMNHSVTDYAPSAGYLEVTFRLPTTISYNHQTTDLPQSVAGYWPAVWLLPTEADAPTWANGGEIDLMEMMEHHTSATPPTNADATLHFGPPSGDAWYIDSLGQHWGYSKATYQWGNYTQSQTIGFEWQKINNEYWQVTMYLNGQSVWTQNMTYQEITNSFAHFTEGKTFYNYNFSKPVDSSIFGPGGAGDPVMIFNRGFNDQQAGQTHDGFHPIINFAYGGNPFGGNVDIASKKATMVIESFKLWNIAPSA